MSHAGRFFILVALVVFALVPPARAIEIQRVVSPGGIEAWLVRDSMLPIISMSFAFRGGAALDPPGKEGLAAVTASLLDEGAGDLDTLAFHTRLEDLSIDLGFSAGIDEVKGSLRTLTENREEAFNLLKLAVTAPRFDEEAVARKKGEWIAGLRARERDPDYVASRAWYETVFGEHAYGRPSRGTARSVDALTRDDMKEFAARRLARDNLVIGVVGDIAADELARLLDLAFGELPASAGDIGVPEATPKREPRTVVIERDQPQSVVIFGEQGIKRHDPDFYAAYLMNYVLGGGGFSSRLMVEVREKRGLAYSIGTHLQPLEHAALIVGSVATENARVSESIRLVKEEWARMRDHGVTAEELRDAKTYVTGAFALQLDSTRGIADMLLSTQLQRLPIDYIERRNALIGAVTVDDVKRVAQRLLDPEALVFVVVGRPENLAGSTPGAGG
jgi:zinc protease